MVKIAICDNEIKICTDLESILIYELNKLNIEYEIDIYFSTVKLCNALENGAHYDIFFLDIEFELNEMNGVEIGLFIRNVNHNHLSSIVYMSWKKNYALELFEVQPLDFIIKPLIKANIEKIIRTYLKITSQWDKTFIYKIGHDTIKVKIIDIIYIESYDRKLIIHFADGRNEIFYGSLKVVYQEQLKKYDFLFIHNSYAVNYDFITTIKFSQVILNDGTILPVSKLKSIEVREIYYEIMKRRSGLIL